MSYIEAIGELTGRAHCLSFWLRIDVEIYTYTYTCNCCLQYSLIVSLFSLQVVILEAELFLTKFLKYLKNWFFDTLGWSTRKTYNDKWCYFSAFVLWLLNSCLCTCFSKLEITQQPNSCSKSSLMYWMPSWVCSKSTITTARQISVFRVFLLCIFLHSNRMLRFNL